MQAAILQVACLLALVVAGCGSHEPPVSNANQLIIQANQLLAAGDKEKALDALSGSIASDPNYWAYYERAKLYVDLGKDDLALKDCASVLELSPQDPDVLWLQGEIKKPAAKRFQGRFKLPPSHNK